MTTDITELAQDWKTAAHKAKQANDLYLEGKITLSECVVETKDYLDYSDNPNNLLALVEALEKAQQHETQASEMAVQLSKRLTAAEKRIADLETRTVKLPPKIERDYVDGWFSYKGGLVGGGAAEWYNKALDDVRTELTAAGIKVEAE